MVAMKNPTFPLILKGFQKLGLEWLYRLVKEPKRIGRMAKLPLVLVQAAGARLRGK